MRTSQYPTNKNVRSPNSEEEERLDAIAKGYTGNKCPDCHNYKMVENDVGEKCDTCGAEFTNQ